MNRTLLALLTFLCFCCKDEGTPPPPNGPDTTSHNFSFTVDTLGEFGSYLKDVVLLSDGSAWTVGQIYLRDSTGQVEPVPYNLIKWSGSTWDRVRVLFAVCDGNGNEIGTAPLQCNALYAFAPNDIWLTSGGNFVHWNGSSFLRFCLPPSLVQESY